MVAIITVIFLLNFIYYIGIRDNDDLEKDKKYAFKNYFFMTTLLNIFVYFYFFNKVDIFNMKYVYIIFIIIVPVAFYSLFLHIKKKQKTNISSDGILAKQSSYWDIPKDYILSKYENRIVKKVGRNEVEINENEYFIEKKFNGEKRLRGLVFIDIAKPPKLTFIKNVELVDEAGEVYKKVFMKIKEIDKEAEFEIDFIQKLIDNKYILEFYLMSLWEDYAKDWNINSTTLLPLAKNQKEEDFLGALDGLKNINTTKKGINLLSHYFNFKGLI